MNNEVKSEWLEPSAVGSEFTAHSTAMQFCATVPEGKSFGVASRYSLTLLRDIADSYKPKKIVVIDHGETGYEVRRLNKNDSVELFYRTLSPNYGKVEENKCVTAVLNTLADYFAHELNNVVKYDSKAAAARPLNIVGIAYIQRRVSAMAAFRKHEGGAAEGLRLAIVDLVAAGVLTLVNNEACEELKGCTAAMYKVNKELI